MILSIEINQKTYKIDTDKPRSLAIPLHFNGAQPNAYGVEKATAEACRAGEFVGDTRLGGSVNFEQVKFIPHCNGTHTESVGHITHERISVHDCLRDAFIPSILVSVAPEKAPATSENYPLELNENDSLITRKAIEKAIRDFGFRISDFGFEGLIVRTLPNDSDKLTKTYLEEIPPFFSTEAMVFMREIGIKHLLCDLPSIDRIFDGGKLSNHRLFWNVTPDAFELSENSLTDRTITELIYAADDIADGKYLLNLQIAPFASDASPSRPIIFAIN